jgi:hypothetical protein
MAVHQDPSIFETPHHGQNPLFCGLTRAVHSKRL